MLAWDMTLPCSALVIEWIIWIYISLFSLSTVFGDLYRLECCFIRANYKRVYSSEESAVGKAKVKLVEYFLHTYTSKSFWIPFIEVTQ